MTEEFKEEDYQTITCRECGRELDEWTDDELCFECRLNSEGESDDD